MTALKMAVHSMTGRRVVEVYDDSGKFVATINPTEDGTNAIHIVSKHFADDPIGPSKGFLPFPPGYLVRFKP